MQVKSFAAILLLLVAAVAANAQSKRELAKPNTNVDHSLTVVNESGQTKMFTAADLAKLKRVTVKASDHGTATAFEGVGLVDVLTVAGVEFGEKLRGKRLASYLLVEAADKYQVVFALAELDPGFTDKMIILADKRDGKPLPVNAGDWQIVVPGRKACRTLGAAGG